jgi:putative transposase
LFRNPLWAELLLETLHSYRGRAYKLHEYVLMPEHFHVLITPCITLERAVQFIKGGFSFRAKKELGSSMEIWQTGFSDHRVRGIDDYANHAGYIHRNPVGRRLAESASEYPYCSAYPGTTKDDVPQWLKPPLKAEPADAAEAASLRELDSELVVKN